MRVFQKTFKRVIWPSVKRLKTSYFKMEKKDDRRFKKKEVTVLPCGLKLVVDAKPEPSQATEGDEMILFSGPYETKWWPFSLEVLEDAEGGGCQFRFSGSEHVWNHSLVSFCCRFFFAVHTTINFTSTTIMNRMLPDDDAAPFTMFSVEKFSAVFATQFTCWDRRSN